MIMRKVRTTMRPWEEVEVSDESYTDLQRQGLLVQDEETSSNRTRSATGDKS